MTAQANPVEACPMESKQRKPRRPVEQLAAGQSFFSKLDLDVGHFPALWHTFQVGQLLEADLNRIGALHGLSIADFHLLGALMIDGPEPLRATDLALTLNVSNAALSSRISKLARKGLLIRSACESDRRAALLQLTEQGAAKVQAIGLSLEQEGSFVRHFRQLGEAKQAMLGEIMGELHGSMDRDFLPVTRPKL